MMMMRMRVKTVQGSFRSLTTVAQHAFSSVSAFSTTTAKTDTMELNPEDYDELTSEAAKAFAFVPDSSSDSSNSRELFRKIVRSSPRTPGTRHLVKIDRSELYSGKPVKKLTFGLRSKAGRNNQGRITVWHRGSGHKRRYRMVDFRRNKFDVPATVQRLEYDPNRSAHIALIQYEDDAKTLSYMIAPQGLQPGHRVISTHGSDAGFSVGNCMPLSSIPIGTDIHCVEMQPGRGAQLGRSAGTACRLLEKSGKEGYALVRISSKEHRYIPLGCMATIGKVSNPLHKLRKLGKAGRSRWLGRRPTVRGVAMNPVDHPHGGGEGKSGGGRPSVSPWGKHTKGAKTRKRPKNPLVTVPRGGFRRRK